MLVKIKAMNAREEHPALPAPTAPTGRVEIVEVLSVPHLMESVAVSDQAAEARR